MSDVNREIRVIFVEDVEVDATEVEEVLRNDGLAVQLRRVDTREAFLRELESRLPDVILSDHGLPAFDGFAALDVACRKCPQVPFLFVTGSSKLNRETEELSLGVMEHVPKRRLDLLAPAIRRALSQAEKIWWRSRASQVADGSLI
jgi:CheY-like chemotaxis protein